MGQVSRRHFLGTAGIAAAAPLAGTPATAAAQVDQRAIAVDKNVPFGKGGDIELTLDIYKPPAGAEKRMATVHIHGGGFVGGNKETLSQRILPFARRGYVAIAAQYRIAKQAKWPSQMEDVKAAITWARNNASKLNFDPQRIAVVGYSAGGFLALNAAGRQDPQVAACAAFYPMDDATPIVPEGLDAEATRGMLPSSHISAKFAPTIMFHGTGDTTVPIESSQKFFQLLRDAKVTAELHTFAGAPHIFDQVPEYADASALLFELFIDRYVINPRNPFPTPGAGPGRGGRP